MGFEDLLADIKEVMAKPEVSRIVKSRMRSFKALRDSDPQTMLRELAFCVLAANFRAEESMRIVEIIGDRLGDLGYEELASELRRLGHRYPNSRARYIVEARGKLDQIMEAMRRIRDERELRSWLVENIKGLGLKEASHFLRNVGYGNLAIIDFHIIRILRRYGLIEEFRSLTRRRYLEVERLLERIADQLGISLAELDLYLWYMDSGKILK